jgi:predicted DNA-binding transcriptional regulator AlpA
MTKLNRFKDLKSKGFADSWAQLKRMIELYGFPPGRMITPNVRAWTDEELDAYVASQLSGRRPGAARCREAQGRTQSRTGSGGVLSHARTKRAIAGGCDSGDARSRY